MTSALAGFRLHRLDQVPRLSDEDRPEELDRHRRDRRGALAASLTGSHADLLAAGVPDAAVVTAWIRPPAGARLHVLLGGRPYFPPAVGQSGTVLFPPGALATELATSDVDGLVEPFRYWVSCVARPDALWTPGSQTAQEVLPRGSFDRHVAHLRSPFVWLVHAQPLRPAELDPELRALTGEILPLSRGEVGEAKRLELERKQARHRELSRARTGGGWRIRLLVGATDPRGAGTAAAMLCAASELAGLPYVLEPAGLPEPLTHLGAAPPFTSGTELLVALARPPERELPGLRAVLPHGFDVTPERRGEGVRPGELRLGAVLDEGLVPVDDLVLGRDTLNRHTFVCGATGGGKSQTVRHLLTEATRAGLPWLVVEPAKAEYDRMASRIAPLGQDVVVLRPGAPDSAPGGFNPLAPEPGFPLQSHADLLRALFLAAFEAQEPFSQILSAALTRCYEELGWDLSLGRPVHSGQTPRYPMLSDLQRVAVAEVARIGYSAEITGNITGFLKVRLGSLRLGTAGRFLEGGHPLDFAELCRRNVVLQIEDVGDDADKAFLMGAVLMRLSEHLRVRARHAPRRGLHHLTVIEEAHRLLRRPEQGVTGPAAHAVEMFAALLAEVRAYGEGLVIAEQIPSKLTPDVIKNTAVKIVHRLPAKDDRESVGATMNLAEAQSKFLVTLPPGTGAVFTDGMDRPLLTAIPDGTAIEDRGGGRIAPVQELLGRRSPTCGADCQVTACTLREMREAAHLLGAEPWLTVWAELAVLAHLVGRPVPVPAPATTEALAGRRIPVRQLDCALAHAVDQAVATRSAVLHPSVNHGELATHVRGALTAALAGKPDECADDALRYLATPFRWERVRRPLAAAHRADPGSGRDPRSTQWETEFHRTIPGDTRAAQLAAVELWLRRDLADPATVAAVTYGTDRPATIETAIGLTGERADRVTAALERFVDCTWPIPHLAPAE